MTEVVGVWDDHDFGMGNGDRHFAGKDLVKSLYLDFLDENP
jgi:alkaline phosphatase D